MIGSIIVLPTRLVQALDIMNIFFIEYVTLLVSLRLLGDGNLEI
jgi:hypothetical protein